MIMRKKMQEQYQPQTIENNVQQYWQDNNSFRALENSTKQKFYCLSMLPYPSGNLHIGHLRNYTIGDVISRYQRMLGKNVLQPMGWDAFGLPAENAAIQRHIQPAKWTRENTRHIHKQMQQMGLAYDWAREITTCDPEYYRWEQWFFLRLYEKGLAYKKEAEVNWDPVDQTVLANEQVINGRGWRSNALVERKKISQWFFKITAYAEELLKDIEKLQHWPEQVRTMQKNWIGRSEGVDIHFEIPEHDALTIYTTRPDTLFGVTYIAVAAQHPLALQAAEKNPTLKKFIEESRHIKTAEADIALMEKKGMPLDLYAIHPLTHEKIPIWVANFVLMEYGSGALMAVPAHDERDYEFAQKYHLPLKSVIVPENNTAWNYAQSAFVDYGKLIDSAQFTGLDSQNACKQIINHLEEKKLGQRKINYRLRDWGISRQRYWGAPIPIINCPNCGAVPVPDKDLPVVLPEEVVFSGVASPLKNMPEFYETTCPRCHQPATRETDTFDTFVESSWYYARYTCNDQHQAMLDERANYWLPVDQYVGGIEHAVLHLLYARFFHKLMRDQGLVTSDEPFMRLLSQGMVIKDGHKMSKSKGNVVDPQILIEKYGADTARLFMMFAAPPELSLEWSESGVEGAHRFLKRLWAFAYNNQDIVRQQNQAPSTFDISNADTIQLETLQQMYQVLDQAKFDYERQQYNTVVSSCMKILNLLTKLPQTDNDVQHYIIHKGLELLLLLLAPITPHITHQLWSDLNYPGIILDAPWPASAPITFAADTIELVIQVNGKLRSRIKIPKNTDQTAIENLVRSDNKIKQVTQGQTIKKIIIVPGRLVNVVTGEH
jgi:leucyl-tRNA synthetase